MIVSVSFLIESHQKQFGDVEIRIIKNGQEFCTHTMVEMPMNELIFDRLIEHAKIDIYDAIKKYEKQMLDNTGK